MSVTLQQIYEWALSEQDRAELWGHANAQALAAGAVRLADACMSDPVILDRLKAAAQRRAQAARLAAEEKAERAAVPA